MWSVEYVQVPDETKMIIPTKPEEANGETTSGAGDTTHEKGKEPSKRDKASIPNQRSTSCDSYEEDSQSVVNRLQEFKDPDQLTSKYVELGSSVDSNNHFMSKVFEKLEGNSGRESQGAIQSDIGGGNLSEASSMSDIYPGEEGSADGEVESVQSAMSALEAAEVTQSDSNVQEELVRTVHLTCLPH